MTSVPLSVLDLAPVAEGSDNGTALAHTTALAKRVEELGYHRLWVAEHHNMPGIASSAPAVLLAHLAAQTSTIRLGSGGVMLPNHAPLVVAEQFGTLVALHPDRIDLGIGRAPGTDQITALALRRSVEGLSAEDFPQELARLIGYFEAGSGQPRVTAVPGRGDAPAVWLLGSSDFSARLAGRLGLPFSFAHHFSAANTDLALDLYRAEFRPSKWLAEPYAMVAVSAVCADTDERAEYLSLPSGLSFLRLRQGRPGRMPSPADAAAYPFSPLELEFIRARREGQALGSPETVTEQLNALLRRTKADELMLTTLVFDVEDRIRSFELIAEQVAPKLVTRESP
ncbi:LLM class flavin-dependent oxidoreductase [Virgisporangium ochraceum]|uniref:FMN-linked alkanal monooxygenase n=1 Tax=Virgisporangium ochraceum TaxID=65505 RepID=A0A8J4A2Y4_9ACTN|nr:LLM class flavin-dependent oxidoreductase [Virgisporangium ochraceum]GIJ74779.1 FMN-linked alkanal monooxygenase [Virgisporangium ochraceum]